MRSNFGMRRLIDQQLRYRGPGSLAWLRVKNFVDPPDIAEMGIIYTPPATGSVLSGTTDIAIDPRPVVSIVSMHNIGQAAQAGMNLLMGARNIMVSHTWVKKQQKNNEYNNPRRVFEDSKVIGIVTEGLLVSIESAIPDYAFGEPVNWFIVGNATELK